MTQANKTITYWTVGIVGVLVVLVVLAYVYGWYEFAATGTS